MAVLFTRRGAPPASGKRASDYEVGESVFLSTYELGNEEFLVVHQGNPDSSIYDASCNGTWLLIKNGFGEYTPHSNDDYGENSLNGYLQDIIQYYYSTETQNAIKQIKLPYWQGTRGSGSYKYGSNGLLTKGFILSDMEVGFTNYIGIGAKLDYFDSGEGTSANNKRILTYGGTAFEWWLRSFYGGGELAEVTEQGRYAATGYLNSLFVRCAFVIDSSTKFDPDTNIIIG